MIQAVDVQSHIDGWVKEWDLSTAEQQKLYLAVADLFRANKVSASAVPGSRSCCNVAKM